MSEELDFLLELCTDKQKDSIRSMLANFQLKEQDFLDKWEAAKFNLQTQTQGADQTYVIDQVIRKINDDLLDSKKDVKMNKAKPAAMKGSDKSGQGLTPTDVFRLIDQYRGQKLSQQMSKMTIEERKALNTNAKQAFTARKSRGQNRTTFNDQVMRIPGVYNLEAEVEITPI